MCVLITLHFSRRWHPGSRGGVCRWSWGKSLAAVWQQQTPPESGAVGLTAVCGENPLGLLLLAEVKPRWLSVQPVLDQQLSGWLTVLLKWTKYLIDWTAWLIWSLSLWLCGHVCVGLTAGWVIWGGWVTNGGGCTDFLSQQSPDKAEWTTYCLP